MIEVVEAFSLVVRVSVSIALLVLLVRAFRLTGSHGFLVLAAAASVAPWATQLAINPLMAQLARRFDPEISRADQALAGTALSLPIDVLLVTWAVVLFSRDIERRRSR